MAIKTSTGLRDYLLATGAFKTGMDGGFLKLYGGTVPSTADAALGGATLLCTLTESGDTITGLTFDSPAVSGVLSKAAAEVWSGLNVATDTVTFYRFVTPSDDGTLSTTQRRVQGTVGLVNADLIISDTGLTSGAPQLIDGYVVALPTF